MRTVQSEKSAYSSPCNHCAVGGTYCEKFIPVSNLTRDEADQLLAQGKKGAELSREEKDALYDNLGTSPGLLMNFFSSDKSVDEFVADFLHYARYNVATFPLVPIVTALKEHPEGVELGYFGNLYYNGVRLATRREVGAVMRDYDSPILYGIETCSYVPRSRAHEVALRSYDAPAPRSTASVR